MDTWGLKCITEISYTSQLEELMTSHQEIERDRELEIGCQMHLDKTQTSAARAMRVQHSDLFICVLTFMFFLLCLSCVEAAGSREQ